ncbi:MAG TPA: SRPBCC family protein [Anaerolineales bacterium]|nr:SRPBCC family protein [Anaerolineales bacterium]
MTKHSVSVSTLIEASSKSTYDLIADYRDGHPRILPKPYFVSLDVERGGYGAGTVINFQMKLMGRLQSFHSVITEPEPGRVLVETVQDSGTVTTFTVDSSEGGQHSFVTITTTTEVPDGLIGKIQGWFTTQLLRPVYEKELQQLAAVVKEQDGKHGYTNPSPTAR